MTAKEKEKEEEKEEVEEIFHERRRKRRRGGGGGGIVWGLILLSLGAIFLLNNFGFLPWGIWSQLWRLWPLILIFIAVEIIFGRTFIGKFIVSIFVLGILGLIFIYAIFPKDNVVRRRIEFQFPSLGEISLPSFDRSERITKTLRVEAEEYEDEKITRRQVDFDLGSSRLTISDSEMADFLVVDATYFEGLGEPVVESDLDNGVLKIRFFTKDTRGFSISSVGERKYDVKLGRQDIESDLDINLGSGLVEVDLSGLTLRNIKLNIGSGSANVELTSSSIPKNNFDIDIGSGSINLRLPSGAGLKTDYNIGSGSLKIEGNTVKGEGTYTSSSYSTAETRVELDLNIGSGTVTITTN